MAKHGWAIQTEPGGRFIGKYWWFDKEPPEIPDHMDGYKAAVFPTRAKARAALPNVRRSYAKAAVRKVFVNVTTSLAALRTEETTKNREES